MKKLLFTSALLICLGITANAQISIDVRGGFSLVKFGGPDALAWSFMDNASSNWKPAFHIGGSAFIHNFNPVVLEGGLYFSSKGTIYKGTVQDYEGGIGSVNAKTVKTLNYIDIPLHVRFYFNEHLNIYAGPQFSFLLSAKYTDEIGDQKFDPVDAKEEYNSFDLSIDIGIAYQLNSGLNFQVGYEHGLLDIVKYGNGMDYTVMNRGIKISIGYKLFNPEKEDDK